MKRIEAIIRPEKVSEVCAALDRVGYAGVTLSHVEGHEDLEGWTNHIRGISYTVHVMNKTRVEAVVKDEDTDKIIKIIFNAALTGKAGDGRIFVHDIADAIRIRTNANGMMAV